MSVTTTRKKELYDNAWNMCRNLKGSMDGSESREYIFAMLFYRYISESFCQWFNRIEWDRGQKDYDYANLSEEKAKEWRKHSINLKGFFIPPDCLFQNVYKKLKINPDKRFNINMDLKNAFKVIEKSAAESDKSNNMNGLLTYVDWEDKKLGASPEEASKSIWKMMTEINALDLHFYDKGKGSSELLYEDNLGDLYEYLMEMYASEAGKKAGEFYTPAKVSELLANIVIHGKSYIESAYDPTCGSGSLLLKFIKILGKDNVRELCGQEKIRTTYNLCRMNMILHHMDYSQFDIRHGDTLDAPYAEHLQESKFDAVVANPPYSAKWREGDNDEAKFITDPRFDAVGALPPRSRADYAFILHCLYVLSPRGKAAIVCPTGVLNRKDEAKFRKYLLNHNYIESVILLPGDLFFGTSIVTVIMVLNKGKKDNSVLFINASNQFVKEKGEARLSDKNLEWILDHYKKWESVEFASAVVSKEEIEANDYDFSVKTYVKQPVIKKEINIKELNEKIAATVKRVNELRAGIDAIIKEIEEE